ncbi:MAG TPA: GxxExxY protein [Gemmatimonadaceae bacterium]|nr:GxxExxY protein [Gemmatimonadaceae bacterium]
MSHVRADVLDAAFSLAAVNWFGGEIVKETDEISGTIVDAAFRLHMDLGPGLLESVYASVLARDLERRGLVVERQRPVSFRYDDLFFEEALRLDLLVEKQVIVEVKSVERLIPVHSKQLLTYLRVMNLHVGLLINFGSPTFKEGIRRIVNDHRSSLSAPPRLRVNKAPASPPAVKKRVS